MNDDRLVEWLLDEGYSYDYGESAWTHRSTGETVERREERLATGIRRPGEPARDENKLKGLRDGFINRNPNVGSYVWEIENLKDKLDDEIKTVGAATDFTDPAKRQRLVERILRDLKRDFSPLFPKSQATDKVFDSLTEKVEDAVEDEADKVDVYGKALRDAYAQEALDRIKDEIDKQVAAAGALARNISKTQQRIDILESNKQAFEREWDADRIKLGRYNTVQSFTAPKGGPFGFLKDNPADLDRLKRALRTKGFEILPPDARGIERIRKIENKSDEESS